MAKVYSIYKPHPPEAVLVDRRTKFGNPFHIGVHGTREEVIDKYEHWIWQPEQAALRRQIMWELQGKDLLCHCAPKECHADVLLAIANAP